jgi:type II secretory pathway predicted ATPase ExeA
MDEQNVPGSRSESAVAATAVPHLFTAQQTALAEMMRAMDSGARWVVLIGDDGSGKSTVIRALLDELRLTAASVVVSGAANAGDADLLVDGVRHQLGLPPRNRKLLGAGRSISEIVASQAARGTPLVVVIDDANALSGASVKWLARLAASASRSEASCYVVLAGTTALDKPASRAWASARSGGPSVRSELGPLTPPEMQRYVEHCAAQAAVKFSEAALRGIELYSKGRPGRVAQLCARSVTLPSTRITSQVSAEAVAETAERLGFSGASAAAAKRESRVGRGAKRRVLRRVAAVTGTTLVTALVLYLGTRVGLRLIEMSPLAWPNAATSDADRSTAPVVRSPNARARGESTGSSGLGSGRSVAAVASTPQRRDQRSGEGGERATASQAMTHHAAALMARARDGEIGELKRLIADGVSPNARDVGGFTPLMGAVVNDQVPAARTLLDAGAEVNARAHGGLTPLMLAVINDRRDAVKLLLERGADINAQTGAGWTAYTFAVWKGDAELERLLLGHGAKPNVVDKQGWRPLEYAPPRLSPADSGGAESAPANVPGRR